MAGFREGLRQFFIPSEAHQGIGQSFRIAEDASRYLLEVEADQLTTGLAPIEDRIADDTYFMAMLGRVWATGASFDWSQIWGGQRRNRLVLPTYPFQHNRYFIEPQAAGAGTVDDLWLSRIEDRDAWSWRPVWKPAYADVEPDVAENLGADTPENWLIFEDETGLGASLAEKLRAAGLISMPVCPATSSVTGS